MRAQRFNHGLALLHEVPVPGRDLLEVVGKQFLEGVHVRRHVAVGRQNHRRHAFENMIAGDQQPLALPSGSRRNSRHAPAYEWQSIRYHPSIRRSASAGTCRGFEGHVLTSVAGRRHAYDGRAGAPAKLNHERRMIAMRVRGEHPTDVGAAASRMRFQMPRIIGPWIDARPPRARPAGKCWFRGPSSCRHCRPRCGASLVPTAMHLPGVS